MRSVIELESGHSPFFTQTGRARGRPQLAGLSSTTRWRDLLGASRLAQELRLVRPAREADERLRRELAQPGQDRLDVALLVEHVRGEREVESVGPRLAPVPHLGGQVKPVARGVLRSSSIASVGPVGRGHLGAAGGGDERRHAEAAAELDDAQAVRRRAARPRAPCAAGHSSAQ